MGKLNLSRSEVIFCGIMLLGAAGFGIHRLGQAIYKMQEPQIFEDAARIIPLGETLSLTVVEVAVKKRQRGRFHMALRQRNRHIGFRRGNNTAAAVRPLFRYAH